MPSFISLFPFLIFGNWLCRFACVLKIEVDFKLLLHFGQIKLHAVLLTVYEARDWPNWWKNKIYSVDLLFLIKAVNCKLWPSWLCLLSCVFVLKVSMQLVFSQKKDVLRTIPISNPWWRFHLNSKSQSSEADKSNFGCLKFD